MQDYPAFRRAILHFGVRSLLVLTRPPLSRYRTPEIRFQISKNLYRLCTCLTYLQSTAKSRLVSMALIFQ